MRHSPQKDEEREEVENKFQMAHLLAIVFLSVEQMQMVMVMSSCNHLTEICVLGNSLIDSTSGKFEQNVEYKKLW